MDTGLSYNALDVAYATRTVPLGQFWITGGAALPAGRTTIEDAIDRLNKQRLLVDGKFTDQHKAALLLVRRPSPMRAWKIIGRPDFIANRMSGCPAAESLRVHPRPGNSLCPCGSGKRYKRCCGAKA